MTGEQSSNSADAILLQIPTDPVARIYAPPRTAEEAMSSSIYGAASQILFAVPWTFVDDPIEPKTTEEVIAQAYEAVTCTLMRKDVASFLEGRLREAYRHDIFERLEQAELIQRVQDHRTKKLVKWVRPEVSPALIRWIDELAERAVDSTITYLPDQYIAKGILEGLTSRVSIVEVGRSRQTEAGTKPEVEFQAVLADPPRRPRPGKSYLECERFRGRLFATHPLAHAELRHFLLRWGYFIGRGR